MIELNALLPFAEIYRPKRHFSPPFGWMNDPNGLVYSKGVWHLFYQYYPNDTFWGPMHWGHAVSKNLVDWQSLPIALAPDELGYIFSGSAVVDEQNVSGLFESKSERNLVAFYTASLNVPQLKLSDLQSQCVAFSRDGGVHWQKYADNPVLPSPFIGCFRDPKVIWHAPSRYWIMVVTHGQSIGFYRSQNLLDWAFCSEFGQDAGFHSQGPWECPDLFELPLTSGESKWVLVVGIGSGCFEGSSGTQYFVGDFDGFTFSNGHDRSVVKWLDVGRDYYAVQTWSNAPNRRRIGIAWLSNWQYARNTDTQCFRGMMTAPKSFYLEQNDNGYYLAQSFAPEFLHGLSLQPASQTLDTLCAATFYLKGEIGFSQKTTALLSLFNGDLRIQLNKQDDRLQLTLTRQYHGEDQIMRQTFPHHYQITERVEQSSVDFELFVDNGTTELHLAQGKISVSQLCFPKNPQTTPQLNGDWRQLVFSVV